MNEVNRRRAVCCQRGGMKQAMHLFFLFFASYPKPTTANTRFIRNRVFISDSTWLPTFATRNGNALQGSRLSQDVQVSKRHANRPSLRKAW